MTGELKARVSLSARQISADANAPVDLFPLLFPVFRSLGAVMLELNARQGRPLIVFRLTVRDSCQIPAILGLCLRFLFFLIFTFF